jgi:hypothetical protein
VGKEKSTRWRRRALGRCDGEEMEEGRVRKRGVVATRRAGRRRGPSADDVWSDGGCGMRPLGASDSPGTAAPNHERGEQGKRKGEKGESGGRWPVGRPAGWGLADGGEGGYDRWARARKRKQRKKERERKHNQFEFEIDTSNLLKLDLTQIGPFRT